jgi:hypothetical protein
VGVPQAIVIGLYLTAFIQSSFEYYRGKKDTPKYIGSIIGIGMMTGLLIWGGFWR